MSTVFWCLLSLTEPIEKLTHSVSGGFTPGEERTTRTNGVATESIAERLAHDFGLRNRPATCLELNRSFQVVRKIQGHPRHATYDMAGGAS